MGNALGLFHSGRGAAIGPNVLWSTPFPSQESTLEVTLREFPWMLMWVVLGRHMMLQVDWILHCTSLENGIQTKHDMQTDIQANPCIQDGCTLPHPWGVPHKLAHWDRDTFPQHIPYFPIYSWFYDDLWRQLHRLRLYPQPPRPLLYLFIIILFVPLHLFCLKGFSFSLCPPGTFPYFLNQFLCVWLCDSKWYQTKCYIYWNTKLSPIHEVVGAEPCS